MQPKSFEIFQNLGIVDDVMALCKLFPPMKLYKAPENTEVLKIWDLVEKVEPTPDSPWVYFCLFILMLLANKTFL